MEAVGRVDNNDTIVVGAVALCPVVQRASRPVQILRKNPSLRRTAPRSHKQPNHPVANEKQKQHQNVAVLLDLQSVTPKPGVAGWM
jgi:hypothetical protein